MKQKEIVLDNLTDKELLQMRIKDLKVQIQGCELERLVEQLYEELNTKGISFHPPCYLTNEWFCPDREPIIGIPFFLAHPRLKRIEQQMMLEVEGGTEKSCMKLLRHEAGHALNYAYRIFKKTRWRELFGHMSARYSDSYHFRPYSKRFVIHLEHHYAQCHPDEDFAETFAVWLTPNSDWQRKYIGWPAIKKLQYIDFIAKRICAKPPLVEAPSRPPWSASRMTSTLEAYYGRKRKLLGNEFQAYYDNTLKTLFKPDQTSSEQQKASGLLRMHRRQLVNSLAKWTEYRKYDISQLVDKLISRCDALGLVSNNEDIISAATLIATIASNTLRFTKKDEN